MWRDPRLLGGSAEVVRDRGQLLQLTQPADEGRYPSPLKDCMGCQGQPDDDEDRAMAHSGATHHPFVLVDDVLCHQCVHPARARSETES